MLDSRKMRLLERMAKGVVLVEKLCPREFTVGKTRLCLEEGEELCRDPNVRMHHSSLRYNEYSWVSSKTAH